jgi:hypothetical protein
MVLKSLNNLIAIRFNGILKLRIASNTIKKGQQWELPAELKYLDNLYKSPPGYRYPKRD